MNDIKASYHYINSLNSEHSIKGLSIQQYNQEKIKLRSLPIKYKGIQKITIFNPNEIILEENNDFTVQYINNGNEFTDILINFIIGGYSVLNSYPSSSDIIKFDWLRSDLHDVSKTRGLTVAASTLESKSKVTLNMNGNQGVFINCSATVRKIVKV